MKPQPKPFPAYAAPGFPKTAYKARWLLEPIQSPPGLPNGYQGDSVSKQLFENRVEQEWLTTKEAAHFLGVTPNALRIMVHRDQVRVFKFGRRLRFKPKVARGADLGGATGLPEAS